MSKLIGITLTYQKPDGRIVNLSLEGAEAEKCRMKMRGLSAYAKAYGCMTDFFKLNWVREEVDNGDIGS